MANFNCVLFVLSLFTISFSAPPDTICFQSVPYDKGPMFIAEVDTSGYSEEAISSYALEARCGDTAMFLNNTAWCVTDFSSDGSEKKTLALQINTLRPCANASYRLVKSSRLIATKNDQPINMVKFCIDTMKNNKKMIVIDNLPCFLNQENPCDWQIEIDAERYIVKRQPFGSLYPANEVVTLTLEDTLFSFGWADNKPVSDCKAQLRIKSSGVVKKYRAVEYKSKVEKPANIDWIIKYDIKSCRLVRKVK